SGRETPAGHSRVGRTDPPKPARSGRPLKCHAPATVRPRFDSPCGPFRQALPFPPQGSILFRLTDLRKRFVLLVSSSLFSVGNTAWRLYGSGHLKNGQIEGDNHPA